MEEDVIEVELVMAHQVFGNYTKPVKCSVGTKFFEGKEGNLIVKEEDNYYTLKLTSEDKVFTCKVFKLEFVMVSDHYISIKKEGDDIVIQDTRDFNLREKFNLPKNIGKVF